MISEHVECVSWPEHRTNMSTADEFGVTSGTLLNFFKKQLEVISEI